MKIDAFSIQSDTICLYPKQFGPEALRWGQVREASAEGGGDMQ